jgi:hypothetical protein
MEEEINSLLYIGNFVALLNDELDETIAWTDQFEPSMDSAKKHGHS